MSTPFNPIPPRPRNRQTEAAHKRATFWQIYMPMWAAVLLALFACIMTGLGAWANGGAAGRLWADISLAFLILQAMFLALPLLIVLAGLAFGLWYLRPFDKLPPYFKIAQDYAAMIAREVKRGAARAEAPIVQARAMAAGVNQFAKSVQKLASRNSRRR